MIWIAIDVRPNLRHLLSGRDIPPFIVSFRFVWLFLTQRLDYSIIANRLGF